MILPIFFWFKILIFIVFSLKLRQVLEKNDNFYEFQQD